MKNLFIKLLLATTFTLSLFASQISPALQAANDAYYKQQNNDITAYRELAKTDILAKAQLAKMYYLGLGTSKKITLANSLFKEVLPGLREKAQEGNLFAQYLYAYYLDYGFGMQEDTVQAIKWYQLSANKGCHISQNNLGVAYQNGRGVPKDEKRALSLYEKAAKQGNKAAKENLNILENEKMDLIEKMLSSQKKRHKKSLITMIKIYRVLDACPRPNAFKSQTSAALSRSVEYYNSCRSNEEKKNIAAFKRLVERAGGTFSSNGHQLSYSDVRDYDLYLRRKYLYLKEYLYANDAFIIKFNKEMNLYNRIH